MIISGYYWYEDNQISVRNTLVASNNKLSLHNVQSYNIAS
jgi:hypothetical protein